MSTAEELLTDELDVRKLLKRLRMSASLFKNLRSKQTKKLVKINKDAVIKIQSSSSEDSALSDFEGGQKTGGISYDH